MKQEEKAKFIGEKIMGWIWVDDYYFISNPDLPDCKFRFDPFHQWRCCGMLMDKVDEAISIEIWNGHPEWRARVHRYGEDHYINEYSDSFTECVTEAIYKLYSEK